MDNCHHRIIRTSLNHLSWLQSHHLLPAVPRTYQPQKYVDDQHGGDTSEGLALQDCALGVEALSCSGVRGLSHQVQRVCHPGRLPACWTQRPPGQKQVPDPHGSPCMLWEYNRFLSITSLSASVQSSAGRIGSPTCTLSSSSPSHTNFLGNHASMCLTLPQTVKHTS